MVPEPSTLRELLAAGVLAPSAENKHYLAFKVRSAAVELHSTDVASWSEMPHRKWLALLSYGAVVENLALASSQKGLALEVMWSLEAELDDGLVARLAWSQASVEPDRLAAALPLRHTNRRFFRRAAVAAATLERIATAATGDAPARVEWLDEPARRTLALNAIRIAETERFRQPNLHRELFGAVRFDVGWKATCDEGLPPVVLEVEPPLRQGFALLRQWPLMRMLTPFGAHIGLGLRAGYWLCASAPTLGVVTASSASRAHAYLAAGRAFQRAWLAATAEGLAVQPMAAAVALASQRPGNGWVSPAVHEHLADVIGRLAPSGAEACMLFRIGHAPPPSGRTSRPAVDVFVDPPDALQSSP